MKIFFFSWLIVLQKEEGITSRKFERYKLEEQGRLSRLQVRFTAIFEFKVAFFVNNSPG